MKKSRLFIFIIVILCGTLIGSSTCFAYVIWINGGFSPKPAYISCYSGLATETKIAVHNGCLQWNVAGKGDLVYRATIDHNTTTYPLQNSKNEITKGNRGSSSYCMQTCSTQTSYPFPFTKTYLTEVDIDINGDKPWSNATPCPYDYLDVGDCMTHEIGHLLGLDHSSVTNPKSTMTEPAVRGSVERRTIEQDDKNGIATIY